LSRSRAKKDHTDVSNNIFLLWKENNYGEKSFLMIGLKIDIAFINLCRAKEEKNMNDCLTKNRRYIMKDYSLFLTKVR
jgi:hypothetical protein